MKPFMVTPAHVQEANRTLNSGVAAPLPRKRSIREVLGWMVFVAVSLLVVYLLKHPSSREGRTSQMDSTMIVAGLISGGGSILLIYVWFVEFRKLRTSQWSATTLQVRPDGLTWHSTPLRRHWRWEAFTEASESANLIILKTRLQNAEVIPKTAFDTEEELHEFMEILSAKVNSAVTQGKAT
jgi:hypothetical protein